MLCTAREFLTRALLSTEPDLTEIVKVLTNRGVGTADGFNVNVGFLDVPAGGSRVFHTIEVTPSETGEYKSDVLVTDVATGSNSMHANRYASMSRGRDAYLQGRNAPEKDWGCLSPSVFLCYFKIIIDTRKIFNNHVTIT